MRVAFVTEAECSHPEQALPGQTRFVAKMRNGKVQPVCVFPVGAEHEHPRAWRLVQMGIAVPADDECRKKAGMSDKQMEKAQYAQRRLSSGTPVDEFPLYDAGVILGYKNGEPIPGPRWDEYQAALKASEEIDDEEDE